MDLVKKWHLLPVPILVACLSIAITKYLTIPYEAEGQAFYQKIIPWWMNEWYDPERDSTMNLQSSAAIWGYIVMGGICSLLDCFMPPKWKTQGTKSYFSVPTWIKTVIVCFFNMFVCGWAVTVPVWVAHRQGWFRGGAPLATVDDPLDALTCLKHFVIHSIVIEIWFFSTHWLLHQGPLYRWIHKLHHEYKAPAAVACMYAHPIEFCFGNVAGVILGPALTNAHPYECAFWMTFSLVSTCGSHSGYSFLGAVDHDLHHEHLLCNYGVGVFMDVLFGTTYEGSTLEQQVLKRKAHKAAATGKLS